METIIKAVSDYYRIPDIRVKTREARTVRARQVAMLLIRDRLEMTHEAIASVMRLDRCTVIHGINKISNQMVLYKDLEYEINEIKKVLDKEPDVMDRLAEAHDYFPSHEKMDKLIIRRVVHEEPFTSTFQGSGNYEKACLAHRWKYNTLSKRKLPIEYDGCNIHRGKFR